MQVHAQLCFSLLGAVLSAACCVSPQNKLGTGPPIGGRVRENPMENPSQQRPIGRPVFINPSSKPQPET